MSKRVTNKKAPVRKRKHGVRVVPARSGVTLGHWKVAKALRAADIAERLTKQALAKAEQEAK